MEGIAGKVLDGMVLDRVKADAVYAWMSGSLVDGIGGIGGIGGGGCGLGGSDAGGGICWPLYFPVSPLQLMYARWCMGFDMRVASAWVVSDDGLFVVKLRSWAAQDLVDADFAWLGGVGAGVGGAIANGGAFGRRWVSGGGFASDPSFNSTSRHYRHLRARDALVGGGGSGVPVVVPVVVPDKVVPDKVVPVVVRGVVVQAVLF